MKGGGEEAWAFFIVIGLLRIGGFGPLGLSALEEKTSENWTPIRKI